MNITRFKPKHIVEYLLRKYNQNPRPNSEEIDKMACKTKLTPKQIKRWFKSEWDKRKKLAD